MAAPYDFLPATASRSILGAKIGLVIKVASTAAGFVGFFGYVGRVIQGKGLGWIAQNYGWDAGLWAVLICTAAALLLALLWNVRPRG